MDVLVAQAREHASSLVLVTHSEAAAARADRVLHLTVQGLQEARSRAAHSTAP
jgi:putative ABC transport system ATP-binding protein